MKKAHVILGLILVAMLAMFVECVDEEAAGPTITLAGGEYIDSDETVAPGATLKFSWTAQKGDANLDFITITRDESPLLGWDEKEIPNNQNDIYVDSASFTALLNDLSYTYMITVTDKDALTASRSVVITVDHTIGGNPINSYEAILMGGLNNTEYGSFLDAEEGDVYLLGAASSNPDIIDMVYYYGATNNATLCAPNDPTVNGGSGNFDVCSNWTQKNATDFGTTSITGSEFDDIDNDSEIVGLTGLSESKMTGLLVGNVVAFETVGGKKGLVKVTALENSNSGTITIQVKIQE
jgi:hypothetical protein